MAVIVAADTLAKVKTTLDGVESVGQAKVVVNETLKVAELISDDIKQTFFEDAWRTQARRDLTNMSLDVEKEAGSLLRGDPTMPAGKSWQALRPKVSNLWFYALSAEKWFPPDESSAGQRLMGRVRDAVDALAFGVRNAPAVFVAGVAKTAKIATQVVAAVAKPVASLVGQTAGALLGPLWWVVGIAAVAGVGYLLISTGQAGKLTGKGGG